MLAQEDGLKRCAEGGLGGEGAEEVFEEVGGYGGAVAGCGADVVDGVGFGGEGGAGAAEGCVEMGWSQGGVLQGGFGGVEADGAVGEGGCGEADGLDVAGAGGG